MEENTCFVEEKCAQSEVAINADSNTDRCSSQMTKTNSDLLPEEYQEKKACFVEEKLTHNEVPIISNYNAGECSAEVHKNHCDLTPEDHQEETANIEIAGKPRAGKKLLVLDIDRTIYDCSSCNKFFARRPFLEEFLTSVYKDYDLAIWSVTKMPVLKRKLNSLKINNNENYSFVFYLDKESTVLISTEHGEIRVSMYNCWLYLSITLWFSLVLNLDKTPMHHLG
ncbi:hypothetical protein ILUMI_21189 [Ignelater luminosus]|uniref:FCP1 homology domain-containing protein n=1 Tax=Ignelater luminosus TaxID=2038154 RepID=A0A8K0G441_IGNLU|nr:hypothetical protein ILUMI_21189 [Ignelater luminosus]